MSRSIGLFLLLLGFIIAYFSGILGLTVAVFLWVLGTFLFARTFLQK